MNTPKKVGMISLGCAKNLVDSEVMLGMLKKDGYEIEPRENSADILIVNTCAFIDASENESRQTIQDVCEKNPDKTIFVTGCLVQKFKEKLEDDFPQVQAFLGSGEFYKLPQLLKSIYETKESAAETFKRTDAGIPLYVYDENAPRVLSTPSHTAYVKISEGCNNPCTFCIIPKLRGKHRSRTIESLVNEARNLAKQGVKEINLIGQDTTYYGKDLYGEFKLRELLKQLCAVNGLKWVRLLYAYPLHFSDDMLNIFPENEKLCAYLDMPMQHSHPEILARMGRQGSYESGIKILMRLREINPEICFRTTFIVGFPGETEKHFKHLKNFVREIQFDKVGVFQYSHERQAASADYNELVPKEIMEERFHELMTLQQKISKKKNNRLIGKTFDVLVEGKKEDVFYGRSYREAPEIDGLVFVQSNGNGDSVQGAACRNTSSLKLSTGSFVPVKIHAAFEYDLMGKTT